MEIWKGVLIGLFDKFKKYQEINKARELKKLGRYEEAIIYIDKSLEFDP